MARSARRFGRATARASVSVIAVAVVVRRDASHADALAEDDGSVADRVVHCSRVVHAVETPVRRATEKSRQFEIHAIAGGHPRDWIVERRMRFERRRRRRERVPRATRRRVALERFPVRVRVRVRERLRVGL